MAQRVLSAKSVKHAKSGVVFASFLKLLPPFIIVVPGLIARTFYEKSVQGIPGFENWKDTNLSDPVEANKAYPYLVLKEFPIGLVGLMLASMISAMMASLSAVFNSASTVFTMDVYLRFMNPTASSSRLVFVGRTVALVMVGLSMAWLPVIKLQSGQLYIITQNAITHLAPPLSTVFLCGVFIPRVNGQGGLAGLIVGMGISFSQYVVSIMFKKTCDAASVGTTIGGPWWACMHFSKFIIHFFFFFIIVFF